MQKEMIRALEKDGKKLRQQTGENHGPIVLCNLGRMCSDPTCQRLGCRGEIMEQVA